MMGEFVPSQMLLTHHRQTSVATCDANKATTTLAPSRAPKNQSHSDGHQPNRRFCKVPDCNRLVKSQGVCQRHGAVTKKCIVPGCIKQAQGRCLGMCSKWSFLSFWLKLISETFLTTSLVRTQRCTIENIKENVRKSRQSTCNRPCHLLNENHKVQLSELPLSAELD